VNRLSRLRRFVPVVVVHESLKDWRIGRGIVSDRGAQSVGNSVAQSVDYVNSSFEALLRHGGIDGVEGKHVLEIGPGDNLGVALRFLAAGAERMVCLDRFAITRDKDFEAAVYDELRAGMDQAARERARPERVEVFQGTGIEDSASRFGPGSFDLIVSIAVLEHVADPDRALEAMDRLLKPGGAMLHQIDLRDHGYFTAGGRHPLTFLTLSDRVWRRMTVRSGGPNRKLIDYWRDAMDGYDVALKVTTVAGREAAIDAVESPAFDAADYELVDAIREKLQPPYRALPAEDLLASGVFMVARKPGPPAT
jgi:SAM-dependent methyltransferase